MKLLYLRRKLVGIICYWKATGNKVKCKGRNKIKDKTVEIIAVVDLSRGSAYT